MPAELDIGAAADQADADDDRLGDPVEQGADRDRQAAARVLGGLLAARALAVPGAAAE